MLHWKLRNKWKNNLYVVFQILGCQAVNGDEISEMNSNLLERMLFRWKNYLATEVLILVYMQCIIKATAFYL